LNSDEQQFLNELDRKLWTAANKLLPMLDAAVYSYASWYKHPSANRRMNLRVRVKRQTREQLIHSSDRSCPSPRRTSEVCAAHHG
jgi:hypothetical protein